MNNDERMMEAFGGMFETDIENKLKEQKEQKEKTKKADKKSVNITNTQQSKRLTRKKNETRGRKAVLHSNYSIMFELDEYLIDYFVQSMYLNRKTKKAYLNTLVRNDLIERLKLNREDFPEPKRIDFPEMNEREFDEYRNEVMQKQNEKLVKKWEEYKRKWLDFTK